MAPIPPSPNSLPRIVIYYQTHHDHSGNFISILPLLQKPGISVTHVILAAIHINEDPDRIHLNDHPPHHSRFDTLWAEQRILQASGVKVMGLLGGAAPGTYTRLDGDQDQFERYYGPLKNMIRDRALDGLDLDVEEEMTLAGIVRLIDRLRTDFGKDFIITLTPVAAALLDFNKNLSGFDYEALEVMRGADIAWYNTQFYCGWGDMSNPVMYEMILRMGWPVDKVVIGLVTNPANGRGFVPWEILSLNLMLLKRRHERFAGVMGWEYFNSLPGGTDEPWGWAQQMTKILRSHDIPHAVPLEAKVEAAGVLEIDSDPLEGQLPAVPTPFEYFSDSE